MSRKVIPLRGTEEEHAFWKQAAKDAGLSFSVWARNCLNAHAADETFSPVSTYSQKVKLTPASIKPAGKRSYQPDPR